MSGDRGTVPADSEVAAYMGIPVKQVQDIKIYMQSVVSLDTPLTGNEDMTITDTLQADLSVEDETIDKSMLNTLKMNYGAL